MLRITSVEGNVLIRRKITKMVLVSVLLFPCLGVPAHAAGDARVSPFCIREEMYRWSGDRFASVPRPTFVIDEHCPRTTLARQRHRLRILDVVKKIPVLEAAPSSPRPAAVPEKAGIRQDAKKLVVYFAHNSSFLTGAEKKRLRRFAKALGKGVRVKVVGYASRTGARDYNLWLSTRRAKRVQKQMEIYGVHSVTVRGKGECCPVDKRRLAPNRRVEIYAVGGGGAY